MDELVLAKDPKLLPLIRMQTEINSKVDGFNEQLFE